MALQTDYSLMFNDLCQVPAVVYYYNVETKKWVSSGDGGSSKIILYQNKASGKNYKIVAVSVSTKKKVIDTPLLKHTVYKLSDKFGQFQDSKYSYGINFPDKVSAESFTAAVNAALKVLGGEVEDEDAAPPPVPSRDEETIAKSVNEAAAAPAPPAPRAAPAAPPAPAPPPPAAPSAPAPPAPPAAPAAPSAPPAPPGEPGSPASRKRSTAPAVIQDQASSPRRTSVPPAVIERALEQVEPPPPEVATEDDSASTQAGEVSEKIAATSELTDPSLIQWKEDLLKEMFAEFNSTKMELIEAFKTIEVN